MDAARKITEIKPFIIPARSAPFGALDFLSVALLSRAATRSARSNMRLPAVLLPLSAALLLSIASASDSSDASPAHTSLDDVAVVNAARPKWFFFMRPPNEAEIARSKPADATMGRDGKKDAKKKQSWFSMYGIYIAIFVAISLFQGIREGNAQYLKELEAEEAAKKESAPTVRVAGGGRKKGKGKRNA